MNKVLREHSISGVPVFAVGTTESPGIISCHWDIMYVVLAGSIFGELVGCFWFFLKWKT